MKDMAKNRKSLTTTKGKDTSRRAKPMSLKADVKKNRYACGGKMKK